MKAQLVTTDGERIIAVKNIDLPDDYDGNPYGESVPFSVGSNQWIRTDPDLFTPETE